MFEETNRGDKTNFEDNSITEFITETNYYVTVQLNKSKDKIIFNACIEEIDNLFYSKEFTYRELCSISPILKNEPTIVKIFELISKSIYYNEVNSKINKTNSNLDLIIPINFVSDNKKGTKKTTFQLLAIIRSKEEIIDILTDKVNFLIREKKK